MILKTCPEETNVDHWVFTYKGFLIMTAGNWSLSGLLPEPSCILHADPTSNFRHGPTVWKQKIDAAPWSRHTGKISWLEMAGSQSGETCRGLGLWHWTERSGISHWGHLGTGLKRAEEETLTEMLLSHTNVSWGGGGKSQEKVTRTGLLKIRTFGQYLTTWVSVYNLPCIIYIVPNHYGGRDRQLGQLRS